MLTLSQVFLTTPMFNFLDDTKPLLTKRGIPLGIYWGATVLGFFLLLIVLFILHTRKKRSLKRKAKADRENSNEDIAVMQKEMPADKNKVNPGAQSYKANSMNGKSTSTDRSSQGGSKSSTGWLRNGRVALCGDSHV